MKSGRQKKKIQKKLI